MPKKFPKLMTKEKGGRGGGEGGGSQKKNNFNSNGKSS